MVSGADLETTSGTGVGVGERTAVQHRQRAVRYPGPLAAVAFTVQTKGLLGMLSRVGTISTRFGPTPRAIATRLERMVELTMSAGLVPTFPITATVLDRHPQPVRALAERGVEFAMHGLHHNDHFCEPESLQVLEVAAALRIFERHDIPVCGFRAPYLRANEGTSVAVRAAGLLYESDHVVAFPPASLGLSAEDAAYRRALYMYSALDGARTVCRPSIVDELVRIPVSIPDDEIMLDRLHLDEVQREATMLDMLAWTHERGDMLTMQVHPERFPRFAATIAAVLDEAARLPGGAWLAPMGEVARWWRSRAQCRVEITQHDDERRDQDCVVTLHGDARARLQLTRAGRTTPIDERSVTLRGPVPAVGVPNGAPDRLVAFLREEGYATRHTADPGECAVYLDADTDVADEVALRARIAAAPSPVVGVAMWPDARRCALAVTGDIDAFTYQDFVDRLLDNSRRTKSVARSNGGHGR